MLTLSIQRQNGLNCDIDATKAVLLEHDLGHALTVDLWVHGRLSEQDLAAGGVDLELLVKRVVPEMFHVLPVADDAVLHWLRDLQEVAQFGRLVADHDVLDHEVTPAHALFRAQDRASN